MKTSPISPKFALFAFVIGSFGLILSSAQAATDYYFDPTTTNSDSGGPGTWNMTTADFFDGSSDQVFTAGGNAHFDGTAGTVTVASGE